MRPASRSLLILALMCLIAGPGPAQAEKTYQRVISLYAAHTEMLLRLGARDRIIGVSGQETYQGPETAGWSPPVFTIRDDVEKYLAAKPDLILVRPQHLASGSQLLDTLKRSGVKVYSAQVTRADGLYKYWRELAALVGCGPEAENIILDFDRQVSAYHQAASRRPESEQPGVFLEAIHDQIKTFTPDSLPAWLVGLAGGRNVAEDAQPQAKGLIIAPYGPERLLAKGAQVDIFIAQEGTMNHTPLKELKKRKIYKPLRAFKEGRIYQISEDILARPTPSLLKGLEQLAGLTGLKPDLLQGAPDK
ncbi:MAG: ABC transporter substrate-binding protein [Candidatus Adiutrix sp.]|nr:ABC transporter substrate-binding protein [Candidatus Adiutrix sp.]